MANAPTVAFNTYNNYSLLSSFVQENGKLGFPTANKLYENIRMTAPRTEDGKIDLSDALVARKDTDISRINTVPEAGIGGLPQGGMVLPISEGHNKARLTAPSAAMSACLGLITSLLVLEPGGAIAGPVLFGAATLAVAVRAGLTVLDENVHKDHRNGLLLNTDKTQFTDEEFKELWKDKRFINFRDADDVQPQSQPQPQTPVARSPSFLTMGWPT